MRMLPIILMLFLGVVSNHLNAVEPLARSNRAAATGVRSSKTATQPTVSPEPSAKKQSDFKLTLEFDFKRQVVEPLLQGPERSDRSTVQGWQVGDQDFFFRFVEQMAHAHDVKFLALQVEPWVYTKGTEEMVAEFESAQLLLEHADKDLFEAMNLALADVESRLAVRPVLVNAKEKIDEAELIVDLIKEFILLEH